MSKALSIFVGLIFSFLVAIGQSKAQCGKVLLVVGTTFKPVGDTRTLAAGTVVTFQEKNGQKTFLADPNLVFGYQSGTQVTSQAIGTVESIDISGNIKKLPKSVTVTGKVNLPDPVRGFIPAQLTLSVTQLKQVTTGKGLKQQTKLSGKTAFRLVELASGVVIAEQPPLKLSKDREFQYRWQKTACN